MPARAPSPFPLLLSRLRRTRSAAFSHAEIVNAGLDPNALLGAGLIKRAPAADWSPPECEHCCRPGIDLESRAAEGFVGVTCPYEPPCWPGVEWFKVDDITLYTASLSDLLRAVATANGLTPLDAKVEAPFVSVGFLDRRGLRVPVVFAPRPTGAFDTACVGLRHQLARDALIVLLGGGSVPRATTLLSEHRVVIQELPIDKAPDLGLAQALDAIDPGYRRRRVSDPHAVFDDVYLEFADVPGDHHVVMINGRPIDGFRSSDQRFLRLLLLAAQRASDLDVDGGGWIDKKTVAIVKSNEDELSELRQALQSDGVPDFAGQELAALVKTSPRRDGTIRLAIDPRHIRFDESLANFRMIGELATKAKKRSTRSTPAGEKLARDQASARTVCERLLAAARALGVPGGGKGGGD